MKDIDQICKLLKKTRLEKGLTLREVEKRCGISFSTVSLIENRRHAFSLENLMKLADAYEVPVSFFFQEAERLFHLDVNVVLAGSRLQAQLLDKQPYREFLTASQNRKYSDQWIRPGLIGARGISGRGYGHRASQCPAGRAAGAAPRRR